jgi:hypothetical protein
MVGEPRFYDRPTPSHVSSTRYLAFVWTNNAGKTEEAIRILKAGIEANPARYALRSPRAHTLLLTPAQLLVEF